MEGDSSRTALISAAGTSAKTSCTVVVVSAQNWSQNASSVASTGCGGKERRGEERGRRGEGEGKREKQRALGYLKGE